MKEVKIVRVAKGQEAEGAKQIADFYNEMEKQKNNLKISAKVRN